MAQAMFRDRVGALIVVSENLEEAKPKAGSPRRNADDGGKRTVHKVKTQEPRWTSAIGRFS